MRRQGKRNPENPQKMMGGKFSYAPHNKMKLPGRGSDLDQENGILLAPFGDGLISKFYSPSPTLSFSSIQWQFDIYLMEEKGKSGRKNMSRQSLVALIGYGQA